MLTITKHIFQKLLRIPVVTQKDRNVYEEQNSCHFQKSRISKNKLYNNNNNKCESPSKNKLCLKFIRGRY